MTYEFYADVIFLTNFYLDFLAVYAVSEVLLQKKRILRDMVCCAVSSLVGCILFLMVSDYDVYLILIHFIVNPVMVVFVFFPAKKKVYGKAYGLMYFVVLLLGGSVEWLYGTVAKGRYYELCLLLTAVPVMVFCYILRRKRKNVQRFYPAQIGHKGKTVVLQALYDTGNTLYDPYIKAAVYIVSKEVMEALGREDAFLTRLIPFSSVGCRQGMLEAFTVEYIKIGEGDMEVTVAPAVLAAADASLFGNRPYKMILHSSLSEKMPLEAAGCQNIK